jgi:hypothetical protein
MRMQDVTGMLSPSLWDKAQAAVEALTPAEAAELGRVLERLGAAAAGGDEADAKGFRAAEYEDEYGWKGPPGTNPNFVGKGGNGFGPAAAFLFVIGAILPGVVLVEYPEYRAP